MKMKTSIWRHPASLLLYHSGMLHLFRDIFNKRLPLIINYHEIHDEHDDTSWCHSPDLLTAKDLFADHLRHITQHYQIVPLEEIGRAANATGLAAITFDDGYKGVYSRAFPLLKELGVPATVFLITDFIGTAILPWWESIAARIKLLRALPDDLRKHHLRSAPQKWRRHLHSDHAIPASLRLYKWGSAEERGAFETFLENLPPGPAPQHGRLFLSREEMAEMRSAGITFGSHTRTHPILLWLDERSLEAELAQSREVVAEINGAPSCWFCYPSGIFTEREERAVRNLGFSGAVQTSLYPEKAGRYCLPRIDLVGSNTTGVRGTFSEACTEVTMARLTKKRLLRPFQ